LVKAENNLYLLHYRWTS